MGKFPYPNTDQRILVEYVSANPTGPLHIGHGRWAVLGDVLVSLLKATNHDVTSEFYINDAGKQVTMFYDSIDAVKKDLPIPEDGYHGQYIHDLAEQDKDPLQVNIDHQKSTMGKLDVTFDQWFSEKELHQGTQIQDFLTLLKEKKLVYDQDGALWFKSTAYGDEKDRVLIKADGNFTYFLVDFLYHYKKVERGYTQLINIWGADHHGYVPRVRAGLEAFYGDDYKKDSRFTVMIGQLVSLKRNGQPVRMSKRTGEMITFEEVINEIGPDAVRYFLIEKSPDTHVDFDMDLAVKKSLENPVYYIQYAHARICSILKKSDSIEVPDSISDLDLNDVERATILHCSRVYDVCWDAAQSLAPYRLTHYLFQLAKQFHSFYENCPILSATPTDQKKRLFILTQVKKTLIYVLNILNISAPESM